MHAPAKARAPDANVTTSPYARTTSAIGVETTGFRAARYSGVFVGEIERVAAFSANGMIATSSPARNAGNSS